MPPHPAPSLEPSPSVDPSPPSTPPAPLPRSSSHAPAAEQPSPLSVPTLTLTWDMVGTDMSAVDEGLGFVGETDELDDRRRTEEVLPMVNRTLRFPTLAPTYTPHPTISLLDMACAQLPASGKSAMEVSSESEGAQDGQHGSGQDVPAMPAVGGTATPSPSLSLSQGPKAAPARHCSYREVDGFYWPKPTSSALSPSFEYAGFLVSSVENLLVNLCDQQPDVLRPWYPSWPYRPVEKPKYMATRGDLDSKYLRSFDDPLVSTLQAVFAPSSFACTSHFSSPKCYSSQPVLTLRAGMHVFSDSEQFGGAYVEVFGGSLDELHQAFAADRPYPTLAKGQAFEGEEGEDWEVRVVGEDGQTRSLHSTEELMLQIHSLLSSRTQCAALDGNPHPERLGILVLGSHQFFLVWGFTAGNSHHLLVSDLYSLSTSFRDAQDVTPRLLLFALVAATLYDSPFAFPRNLGAAARLRELEKRAQQAQVQQQHLEVREERGEVEEAEQPCKRAKLQHNEGDLDQSGAADPSVPSSTQTLQLQVVTKSHTSALFRYRLLHAPQTAAPLLENSRTSYLPALSALPAILQLSNAIGHSGRTFVFADKTGQFVVKLAEPEEQELKEELLREMNVYEALGHEEEVQTVMLPWFGGWVDELSGRLALVLAKAEPCSSWEEVMSAGDPTHLLTQLHTRGYVHGDVRLANFVIFDGSLRLIDFGRSRRGNEAKQQREMRKLHALLAAAADGGEMSVSEESWSSE
ncbi:hypothetical protein JCM10213_007411 [Rhodosporidiobolus nylandii]